MTKPKLAQFRVWLDSELLDWTRRDAAYNKRSLSGQISFCVERYKEDVETKKALESHQASSNASEQ
ncbi:hypothetical protein [Parasaccharibacter sp. TMW2.1890]|uniref:hypothetical protein n=1 Tax=Parasaccharibacter sp. TMW2.1890 TaxID=2039289 RepID=UPI00201234B9|nr:hypothetical protein [Parasaccharibacter sp. TMW2.1890]MCL1515221.1 hypothetical protein [Parasaccharibacter sp. TMW2.1890]